MNFKDSSSFILFLWLQIADSYYSITWFGSGSCSGTINWSWLEGVHQIYPESSFVWGKDYMIFLISSPFPSALCRIQITIFPSYITILLCACPRTTQSLAASIWGLWLPLDLHSSICTSYLVWTPSHKKQKLFSFYRPTFPWLQNNSKLKVLIFSYIPLLLLGCKLYHLHILTVSNPLLGFWWASSSQHPSQEHKH